MIYQVAKLYTGKVRRRRCSLPCAQIRLEETAFSGLAWRPEFHVKLHTLTDESIRGECEGW